MDVYEREFGDLLYLRSKPTVYEQFYNANIKRMITKYNFLPADLIECRMQSLWKKLLAKNPALRSRHESNIRDTKVVCAKKKPAKTRQRKPKKNAQSRYKPRQRGSQKSECLTDNDENEDGEGDLFHTPLPGFRSKRNNRRAVKNRYRPLNIRVTRHSPTLLEESERPASPEHKDNEQEQEEKHEDEPSLASDKTTEANQSDASEEHYSSDDTTGISDEVRNGDVSIPKHVMTTHEPSFHTTKDKQNSLVCKNEPDTAATTEHNESDVAGIAKVAQLGHATMRNVTTDAVTSVSCLEYMERKVGRTDQLNSIVKDKKRDTNSVTHVDKDAAGVSDVTKHFATQTTATISASESDDEDRASVALENSDSSEQGILKQPNKLKQLKTTTLPEDVVQDKRITGHLEESCSDFTSHIIEGAATDQLKLQECDKSEVENKQKDKKIRQLNESDTPVMQAHDAAAPEKPVTTTSENDNCEVTGFDKVQKARKSSGEPNVRKPQNESASTSYDRCKVVSKSSLPRATENIQPEKSDHTNAKNKKQEPELNSHDAPTGRKQCRRAEGRDVKTKLSLSYLIEKMAKNYSEYPADDSNKGEKLESKQEPFSVLQYATMPAANKSDAESENDVQKNIAVVSCAEKGHKIWKKALDDEWAPDAGDKSDKLDDRQRPTSLSQNAAVSVMSNKSDASAVTGLHEGHKTCKEPLTDKTLADVGNKSNIKGDNRQRPASVWQHTTASKLGKKSTTDENDVQKDVTVVCTDDKGHKVCKTPQTDKCHADTGSTDKPNRQRPASLNKGVDKSENNVHRNAAVVSRPHKMCKKPFTDKCPIDVDNKSKKLKNGQTASISQHTTMSTPKPADDKRGNNVQENAKTAVEAHKGCNIHKEPPQQSLDIDKKDSNITEAVTKSIIEKDDIGNAATACEKRKEQKKIHEKRQVRQSDSKNKSGQAMASERCMVSTSNTRMDFAPHSAARKKSIETAGKDEMGCSMMIGPAADIVHTRTRTKKDAKGSETPGQAAIAYPTQHISKDAVASPAGLEELKNTGKELQEDTTSSDTNTKMMVSKSFAEGSKKATTATAESQWERKLRGRTVTGCPTPRLKVSAAKATQEAAATKCYDNTEAISDKENSKHPCSPPREYAAHTKLGDNALSKDCFKTPKSVKSVELICPQTPLKCRSLRQKNLRTPVLGNGDALLDEQQSDPETPLGFKAKCTKQLAKKATGSEKRVQSQVQNMYSEHNQQVQGKSEAWMEIETENEEGQQNDPRSVKWQELTRSSKPSPKQPATSTCIHDNVVLDKCQQPAVNIFSQDKGSSVNIVQLSQSMKGDATNDKHQQSDTNGDIEMTQTRSSDDLCGLTQYPTQHSETHKAVQNLSPTLHMQEGSGSEMELEEDEDAHCFTQTLSRMQACSLYSQNEARAPTTATTATGGVLGRELNVASAPKGGRQTAKRSYQGLSENEEQIRKHKVPNEENDPRNIVDNLDVELEAGDDEDGSSVLFNLDDDDEAAASDGSHSFFKMKLTATPLNFLKSPAYRNDSESEEELFPWLADNLEPETNKRKCEPSSRDSLRESGTNRPHVKRLRFQLDDSGRPAERERVSTATSFTTKMYGKRQHTFPIHSYAQKHDDTDHSSVHGNLPPLLSRREAEFFASDDDEDLGHVADGNYEV